MIFGGDEAKHEDYPFAARVGVTKYKRGVEKTYEKYIDWVCSGTLINSWYVVTAAHCHGVNEGRQITRVRLGGDGLFAQDFAIKSKDVMVHERYKRRLTTVQNDISLIRLPHAAQMSAQIGSACLPLHRNTVAKQLRISNLGHGLVGEKITVVGAGYADYANKYSLEFNKESAINKLHTLEVSHYHK
jgi:secreted trypsin-like serine protease